MDSLPSDSEVVDLESDSESEEGFAHDDYMEFYSRPRICPAVQALHGQADVSLDILGRGALSRDFLDQNDRSYALDLLHSRRPKMIGLTPPCTMFSKITQMWNLKKLTGAVRELKLKQAETMFDFAILLARTQHASQRLFFLEQPQQASSWPRLHAALQEQPMRGRPTYFVRFDQCRYGTPMKKGTKFWTWDA